MRVRSVQPLAAASVPFSSGSMAAWDVQKGVTGHPVPLHSLAHTRRAWEFFGKLGSPKYWVAPMVDQSELPFRLLCQRYGATGAYTPMLHSRLFAESAKYREEHFTTTDAEGPLIVQFCGNDPDIILRAAKMVETQCDAVDLNLGCPQRIAKRGGYGAFLMDDLTNVESIVSTLAQGLSIPVTCKIRIFPDLGKTLEYAQMLEHAQCSMLAVHGRTRDQKDNNATRADWDVINAVKNAVTIPVLANGNIRDLQDVHRCLDYTGVDGVLSAQSLLENPTLFDGSSTQLERKTDPVRGCRLLQEYLQLAAQYPVPNRMMKTHVYRLLGDWFSEFTDIREQLNRDRSSSFQECLNFLASVADAVERRIAASGRDHPIPVPIERKSTHERQEKMQAAKEEQRREKQDLAEIGVIVQ